MRQLGSAETHIKPDTVRIEMKADHPAIGQKRIRLSYRENGHAAKALENRGLLPGHVAADEEELAALSILYLVQYADMKDTRAKRFSIDHRLDFVPLRLVLEHA